MKHIIYAALVLILGIQFSNANCRYANDNTWICRDNTTTRIVYNHDHFWFKTYYEKGEGQTEATYVSKSTIQEFKDTYMGRCLMILFSARSGEDISAIEDRCAEYWNSFFAGDFTHTWSMRVLSTMKSGVTELHAVYCMGHDYVRTYDYDPITQLEVHRKDYMNIPSGSYCTEFLSTNKIHWQPPAGRPSYRYY